MARKKLLSEGEIRQFMKLANLRPLAAKRLSEYSDMAGARDEDEELKRKLGATETELGDEDHVADEESDELDVADDEVAAMDDAPVDPEKQEMLSNVVMAVADALGIGDQVDVDVEGDVGAPEELEVADVDVMDMGPEGGEMEVSAEDELVAEIVRRLGEKKKSNRKRSGAPAPSEERLVAEVANRVARRLQRENKKEQMADQLAERIMKRLTK